MWSLIYVFYICLCARRYCPAWITITFFLSQVIVHNFIERQKQNNDMRESIYVYLSLFRAAFIILYLDHLHLVKRSYRHDLIEPITITTYFYHSIVLRDIKAAIRLMLCY